VNNQAALKGGLAIVGIVSLVFVAGCGGGTSQSLNNQPPPPTPTITTISPNTTVAGGAAFTLTITGTNFVATSVVNFGGTARSTTFVSSTQLTAAIPAAAIASTGTPAVTVTNSAPGGGTSNGVNFTITSGTNPVPTINMLAPSSAAVGGPAFTLVVDGSNFVSSTVVRWNGSDRPTAFVNSGEIHAQISSSDIAAAGTAAVTVFNPAPGGGTSNAVNFSITKGTNPSSVAVAPDPTGKFGKFAYVANYGSNSVSMYSIDPDTGALAFIGTVAAGSSPVSVAVDHSGQFAYVANNDSHDISMYTINATTGILTPIGKIPVEGRATSVTVHPSSKFAYVGEGYTLPNGTPDRVSTYTINASTGALTLVGTIATGSPATSLAVKIAIDPSENFAYAAGDGCALDTYPGYVSVYTINSTTGALTPIGSPLPAGWCSSSVTVDPFGKFAYVADQGGPDVAMYTINANTGALTPIGSMAAGIGPSSVAVDPTGKFAYVTDHYDGVFGHDVLMYTIDATTGALTHIGTIATGTGPSSMAVDPTGKFAYVTNFGSNNVSMYSINATTGTLTLIGTVGT
jgi:6-phosphogluconolactonase